MGVYGLQVIVRTLARDWEDLEIGQQCIEALSLICCDGGRNSREFAEIFLKVSGHQAETIFPMHANRMKEV